MMKNLLFILCSLCRLPAAAAQDATHADPADSLCLVWQDEFDYTGAPDSTRWQYEYGFVRNEELQWYQPQNARVNGDVLQLIARRERVPNPGYQPHSRNWRRNREAAEFTSACVLSRDRFSFRYGRLEVRARIPVQPGAWPAIWTLGNRWGWPACGEIDIMEFYRVPPATMGISHTTASRERTLPIILANACWQGPDGRDAWDSSRTPLSHFTDRDAAWADQFHVWRMDWTPEAIRLYLDDELLNDIPAVQAAHGGGPAHDVNPFANDVPGFGHYILLNLAVGSCGGTPAPEAFPMVYEIDYVRVYQRQ